VGGEEREKKGEGRGNREDRARKDLQFSTFRNAIRKIEWLQYISQGNVLVSLLSLSLLRGQIRYRLPLPEECREDVDALFCTDGGVYVETNCLRSRKRK
jgi:hypothetical protein